MTPDGLLIDGSADAPLTLVLAHGAGAPMDSPFMDAMARQLAPGGPRVVRFEFPYMRARRETGARRPPDREPVLRQTWLEVISRLGGGDRLVIGGKSLVGRMASLVADEARVRGPACVGTPFDSTGQPHRVRVADLACPKTDSLATVIGAVRTFLAGLP